MGLQIILLCPIVFFCHWGLRNRISKHHFNGCLHGYDAEPDAHDPYVAKNLSINMKIKCKGLPTMKL